MIDLFALAFVLLGTCLATVLQSGWRDTRACLRILLGLVHRGFDEGRAKADLAHQIEELRKDGLLRAEQETIGDEEFGRAAQALIGARSLGALLQQHEQDRSRRLAATEAARKVLNHAGELAPVLGLAGTLLSLGRLASLPEGGAGIAGTIGLAVTTTFYGLFIAHAIFMPLAGLVERRARTEDGAREDIFRWLEEQVRRAEPRIAGGERHDRAAA